MKPVMKLAAALSVTLVGMMGTASADPWKDESGHGKARGSYERRWDGDRDHHRAVTTAGVAASAMLGDGTGPMTWTGRAA